MKKRLISVLAVVLSLTMVTSGYAVAAGAPEGAGYATETAWSEDFEIAQRSVNPQNVFNEDGLAWLALKSKDTSEKYDALVNTHGEIVYFSPMSYCDFSRQNFITMTTLTNDRAAVYDRGGAPFIIVNNHGEEIYESTDDTLQMRGSFDDGTYLLVRHEAGFDHDYYSVHIMDAELNIRDTGIQLDNDLSDYELERIGDGEYVYKEYYDTTLLNTNEGLGRTFQGKYEGQDDENIYLSIHGTSRTDYSAIDRDLAFSPAAPFEADPYGTCKLQTGYVETTSDHIDQVNGRLLPASYPEFSEGVKYLKTEYLSGGYAAIYMKGVDENDYATILDADGEMQYEPTKLTYLMSDSINYHGENSTSYCGYIFNHGLTYGPVMILAPDGTEKVLGEDDLPGLEDASFFYSAGSLKLAIGGGYILTGDYNLAYYSTDGTRILDSFTANYNSSGQLVYTDQNGEKRVSGVAYDVSDAAAPPTSQSAPVEKNYITVNDFSIDGKWKNVGDTTWGQVQAGAIVTFDGYNCNFFSPMDTYAFYKDGDDYKLDTTSLLADTVSSTVKIIDEDHIDIVRGSTVLEMTRVE